MIALGRRLKNAGEGLPDAAEAHPAQVEPNRPADHRAVAAPSAPVAREPDRFELKYWVPEEMLPRIIEYAAPYLVLDPHSAKANALQQCNTSLYLETPDLGMYRAHVDSSADRYKLRVRAYGDPPRGACFFEMKRRINTRSVKTRAAVPMDQVQALLEGTYTSLPPMQSPLDRRHLENFLYAQTVTHASPYVLVRAFRESYCSVDPLEDVRLTFDRRISFQPAAGAHLKGDPDRWTSVDGEHQHGAQGPHAMVEMKFPGIAPFWMLKVVDQLELRRVSYSKYISSVRALLDQGSWDASAWDSSGGDS